MCWECRCIVWGEEWWGGGRLYSITHTQRWSVNAGCLFQLSILELETVFVWAAWYFETFFFVGSWKQRHDWIAVFAKLSSREGEGWRGGVAAWPVLLYRNVELRKLSIKRSGHTSSLKKFSQYSKVMREKCNSNSYSQPSLHWIVL